MGRLSQIGSALPRGPLTVGACRALRIAAFASVTRRLHLIGAAGVLLSASGGALAQSGGLPAGYTLYRAGLIDAEHTSGTGVQSSRTSQFISTSVAVSPGPFSGFFVGNSTRYNGGSSSLGVSTWIFDPRTNSTVRTGLTGAVHTNLNGSQESATTFLNQRGQAAGYSLRYSGGGVQGRTAWVFSPLTSAVRQVGLYESENLSTFNRGYSEVRFQNDAGQVAGYSLRYSPTASLAGGSAWVYNPATDTTLRLGFTDAAHTGTSGGVSNYQASNISFQALDGAIAGTSLQPTISGRSTWYWTPGMNAVVRTGYYDAAFTAADGRQFSTNLAQAQSGHIVGHSAMLNIGGQRVWSVDPATGQQTRLGLQGAEYLRSGDLESSEFRFQNSTGSVTGLAMRYNTAGQSVGRDAWLYSPSTNTTARIGLGSEGPDPYDRILTMSGSGHVVGESNRVSGSVFTQNLWVHDPVSNAASRTGLFGPGFVDVDGRTFSEVDYTGPTGVTVGTSNRYVGFNGRQGTWYYNPQTNSTVRTGLVGGEFTGADGSEFSDTNSLLINVGLAGTTGQSLRFVNNTPRGFQTWVYSTATNTTIRTGLNGPEFVDTAGNMSSSNIGSSISGFVTGTSTRYRPQGTTTSGTATWAYSPITQNTVRTGLTDSIHTSSLGTQTSGTSAPYENGVVVGSSTRYSALGGIGSTPWYFDPTTTTTYDVMLGVAGSVRADGFAMAGINTVTADGFALGAYEFFAPGTPTNARGTLRIFAYRPDLGFSELQGLVVDTAPGAADQLLQSIVNSSTTEFIFGASGTVASITPGNGGVFVLRAIPGPGSLAMLALGGVLAGRRRRTHA